MKTKLIYLLSAVCCMFLAGCRDDSAGEPFPLVTADYMIFSTQTGTSTEFNLSLPESRNIVTYRSTRPVTMADILPGDCVFVQYVPQGTPYTTGDIEVLSVRKILNLTPEQAGNTDDFKGYESCPVRVDAAWQMMDRVVMLVSVPFPAENAFSLVVDKSTLDSGEPQAYLLYKPAKVPTSATPESGTSLAVDFRGLRAAYNFNSILIHAADTRPGSSEFRIEF